MGIPISNDLSIVELPDQAPKSTEGVVAARGSGRTVPSPSCGRTAEASGRQTQPTSTRPLWMPALRSLRRARCTT